MSCAEEIRDFAAWAGVRPQGWVEAISTNLESTDLDDAVTKIAWLSMPRVTGTSRVWDQTVTRGWAQMGFLRVKNSAGLMYISGAA